MFLTIRCGSNMAKPIVMVAPMKFGICIVLAVNIILNEAIVGNIHDKSFGSRIHK